ncbi:SRPBCC family protein [soil metagenome]
MWQFEHSVEAEATPRAVWQVWSDVAGWPRWDAGVQRAELWGPFTEGSTGRLTPVGQEPLAFSLTEVRELAGFVDETQLPGAVLRFRHRLEPLGVGRVRITHRIEIEGPSADALGAAMGSALSADVPKAMAT